jgi:CheY-like chemotaxis protein
MNAPLRVAVADDERDIRQFLVQVLKRMGHEVACAAASGRELLEQCLDHPPDLVISDVRMPELGGDEAARRLRQCHPVPVILITAQPRDPSAWDSVDPPLLVLSKPISSQDLAEALKHVLRGKAAADQERQGNHALQPGSALRHSPEQQPFS